MERIPCIFRVSCKLCESLEKRATREADAQEEEPTEEASPMFSRCAGRGDGRSTVEICWTGMLRVPLEGENVVGVVDKSRMVFARASVRTTQGDLHLLSLAVKSSGTCDTVSDA